MLNRNPLPLWISEVHISKRSTSKTQYSTDVTFGEPLLIAVIFKIPNFKTVFLWQVNFTGAEFSYSVIVNTNLSNCDNINTSSGVELYSTYPMCDLTQELQTALDTLKENRNLRKNKLLFVSDTKYNHLNLYLLQKRYRGKLPELLLELNNKSTANITTYKKLERVLNKLLRSVII